MNEDSETTFVLNEYGRLAELLSLVSATKPFSIFVPNSYKRYAQAVDLIDERFGQKRLSKWSNIRNSWAVGRDLSFFSLGFGNDGYVAERIVQPNGMVVRFVPR